MLTHAQARTIASSWHGGGASQLYALTSTGSTFAYKALLAEIADCMAGAETKLDRHVLRALHDYVLQTGKHGPAGPDWARMPWADMETIETAIVEQIDDERANRV